MTTSYRHAVSVLVVRSSDVCSVDGCGNLDSILLVRKPRLFDQWQLPQGGIEQGESVYDAAKRELFEEVGLQLSDISFCSTHTYQYDFPPEFVKRHAPIHVGQQLTFVAAKVSSDTQIIVDQKEVCGFAWVLPEQLSLYLLRQEYLNTVRLVYEEWKGQ